MKSISLFVLFWASINIHAVDNLRIPDIRSLGMGGNALLQKNAETLKMATIEAAKESERGIVDIETLKKTNESLISTFDEIMNIQKEGHQKRMEAEVEMNRLEGELKNKLLEINR